MQPGFKKYILEDSTYKGGGKKIVMPDGVTVHKLSSNENPLGYSPKVKEALANTLDDLSLYPDNTCLLYTSPSPRDLSTSRMPSSA